MLQLPIESRPPCAGATCVDAESAYSCCRQAHKGSKSTAAWHAVCRRCRCRLCLQLCRAVCKLQSIECCFPVLEAGPDKSYIKPTNWVASTMRALESSLGSRVPGRNAFNVRAYDAFMDRHTCPMYRPEYLQYLHLWLKSILSGWGTAKEATIQANTLALCVCGSKQFNRIYIAGCHLSY